MREMEVGSEGRERRGKGEKEGTSDLESEGRG